MNQLNKAALLILALLLLCSGLLWSTGQPEPKVAEKVELEWWIITWRIYVPGFPADKSPEGSEFIEYASKTFMEKNPNVTVKGVMVSNAEFNQKTQAAIAAGTNPNVQWGRSEVVQFAKAGLLVPLDKYLSSEDKQDFLPKALEYFTYDRKVWVLPLAFGNNGMGITNLIYPPMFEEAGVDWKKIVEKGWTMDEFVAVGKKISRDTNGDGENDIFLTGFQGRTPSHLHTDWPWIHNFGGRLLNAAEDKITLDSPETIAAFQFLVDAIYTHKVAPKGAEAADNYGVIQPFHAHKLAMGNGGPYEIGRVDREVKKGNIKPFRPYVAPYPEKPGKKRGTHLVAQGMYVYQFFGSPLFESSEIMPLMGALFQSVYSRSKTPDKAVKDFVKEASAALGW